MNNTQRALWASGLFTAVLTAVLVAIINDARHKLDQAVLDNVRQDSEIAHNAKSFDKMELRIKEMMDLLVATNGTTIRIEERLDSFESVPGENQNR